MGDDNKKKKKKKGRRSRKKVTADQVAALKYINEWVFANDSPSASPSLPPLPIVNGEEFVPVKVLKAAIERVVFEFHSHSSCSDGFLSPSDVVERAHANGVKVLALTDHDTMAGIPDAMEAGHKYGIKIIPGVEISSVYSPREEPRIEEPVHILAYYGICGPSRYKELDALLSKIRDGRHLRAKNMLSKLNKLKMPLKWEHICKIAGDGVAPGRLHVARAMVEVGYVENLKQAFSRYLFDGGPAYAMGCEPMAEEVVQLISHTGGVSALAHPWALKNPVGVIRSLKAAGLHAMEVYRSDGKVSGFCDLADTYELLKLGGSDFHGRGGHDESDLGSVKLPVLSICEFLKFARPVWCDATKDILLSFADEPAETNLETITMFGKPKNLKGCPTNGNDFIDICLRSWLTTEEMEDVEFEAIRLKFECASINQNVFQLPVARR